MVAFQWGHPPFKGNSPHLRPQPSRAESSPTRSKVLPPTTRGLGPTRHASWPKAEEAKPPCAVRVTAQRLQALLHFRPDQRVKEQTAMQAACNRTKGAHPFDFDASSMEARAHTSHATAAPRTTRPVALTLRQDRRHLWQVKQATLRFHRNDRVKKGAPHRSISYPFPFPLSLSYNRDRERGYPERDPSP
jgi:hypothetical protein